MSGGDGEVIPVFGGGDGEVSSMSAAATVRVNQSGGGGGGEVPINIPRRSIQCGGDGEGARILTMSPPSRAQGAAARYGQRAFSMGAILMSAGGEGRFWHPYGAREIRPESGSEDR